MKRALAVLLCVVLLLTALPVAAFAAPQELSEEEALKLQVRNTYEKCLVDAKVESFQGLCGLMTSYQLYELGINVNLAEVCDGNKQFDTYAAMKQTSGGYHITAYSAADYTLETALNEITRNGTRDVQNLLLGFEATTTDAGGTYGHACVIHAIRNGVAYFAENYETYIAGKEGNAITMTIPELVNFYKDWTLFDGVIHFGERTYADGCQNFKTDLFVRSRFETTLRSEPSLLTENDCIALRSIAPGELLHATAVLKNTRGELYYCVDDGAMKGYVAANAVSFLRLNDEALSAREAAVAETALVDSSIGVSGKVIAHNSSISAMRATLSDTAGNLLLEAKLDVSGYSGDLSALCEQLMVTDEHLGEGIVTVYATAACVAVKGAGLATQYIEQQVCTRKIDVVSAVEEKTEEETVPATQPPAEEEAAAKDAKVLQDGWFWQGGTQYCYLQGEPCTGWAYRMGVTYYLKEDGSVTTGFAEVDGKLRFFSGTGALCKGWLVSEDGVRYWDENGLPATFWQQIDGKRYYFGYDGLMVTEGIVADGQKDYQILEDGTAQLIEPTTEATQPQ